MTSIIFQHLLFRNSTYPLRTATAETSWENSLFLPVSAPPHPPKRSLLMCPSSADESFKCAFFERSKQNVHENQQAKSRAS